MRVETQKKIVPVYNIAYDGLEIILQEYIGDNEVAITDIYADEGMVLVDKASGRVMSGHITLGTEDSVENYIETKKEMI